MKKSFARYCQNTDDEIIGLKEAQEYLLDTLRKFQKFCDTYKIRFSLSYGSLLGAIRENNIIPWDDDIDLMMDYENFNKVIMNANNLKDFGLKWYHFTNTKKCYSNEIRIYQDGFYKFLTENKKTFITPLCIDIFLMSKISFSNNVVDIPKTNRDFKKINKLKVLLAFKNRRYESSSKIKYVIRRIVRFALVAVPSILLQNKINKLILKISNCNKQFNYCFSPFDTETPEALFPGNIMDNFITVSFNSLSTYAIKDYETFLNKVYGNWKIPVDRSSGVNFKAKFLKRKNLTQINK